MLLIRHLLRVVGTVARFAIAERSPAVLVVVIVGLLLVALGAVQAAGALVLYPFL